MAGQYTLVITDGVYDFAENDYGRAIPFKLYDPTDAAFNATGYTGYVKIFNEVGGEVVTEISPVWVSQPGGTGTFAFTSTNRIDAEGEYYIEAQLEKSGNVLTFKGLRKLAFFKSPTGTRTP